MSSTARTMSQTLRSLRFQYRPSKTMRRSRSAMIPDNLQTVFPSIVSTLFDRKILQQQRSMVMVTKTRSAELIGDEKAMKESSGALIAKDYTVLSEELIITPSCLARVEKLIHLRKSKGGEEPFLRVFVDAGGCSGFQYQFEIDEEFDPEEDITLVATAEDMKSRIVVDETSLGFLKGSTLDYVQELAKSAFVVADNPQSESACGCGSSFAVKNFSTNPAHD